MSTEKDLNPFKPGAGHSPPYLAGRETEVAEFIECLRQDTIINHVVLTGLRGTGKTVLMEDEYKPAAQSAHWAWVGSDFSESTFLSDYNLCTRIMTDLSVFTSTLSASSSNASGTLGFQSDAHSMSYQFLMGYFDSQPGLVVDKLKGTLEEVWNTAKNSSISGIVFAYDEAQVVSDQKDKEEYPLAVLLETFQSLQRKGVKFLLLLTGLPTLFSRLVESRTYAERMFSVQEIGRLSRESSERAIEEPVKESRWKFTPAGVERIVETSDGYPYFIQFICRETFDHLRSHPKDITIPMDSIIRKLDSDFFAGRWDNLTDRQRDMLYCIACLDQPDGEFSISDVVDGSKQIDVRNFKPGDVSQMLPRLIERGLVYKNRHGKYAFAIPLFGGFIKRKYETPDNQKLLFE